MSVERELFFGFLEAFVGPLQLPIVAPTAKALGPACWMLDPAGQGLVVGRGRFAHLVRRSGVLNGSGFR